MRNDFKPQWLCLENWVYASIRPGQFMLYNTRTGQYIISQEEQPRAIVEKMHERQNLGVVLLEKEWADNAATWQFINEAIEKEIFSFEAYREGALKPIRLMPVLNIQKNVERLKQESDRSVGETALPYLTELTLYVNSQCSLDCKHCGRSLQQFLCCSKDNNTLSLDLSTLEKIATQIKYASILKLNIVGGDIFSYPLLDKISEIFGDKKDKIHFWTHYRNCGIIDGKKSPRQASPATPPKMEGNWNIIVDFPVDEQILSQCIAAVGKESAQYRCHFIVQNEEEINLVENMTNSLHIQDYEMHPYFNGENIDFFKTCVFPTQDDILSNTVSQRRIFCNQALNSNFFGSLTVLPNGDVVANINKPVLGNITTTSVLELITKELEDNTAWRKTRDEKPCSECLFQYLCPPMSNYEMALNCKNLCLL